MLMNILDKQERDRRGGPITYSAELLALTQPKGAVTVSVSISQHASQGQEQSQTYT